MKGNFRKSTYPFGALPALLICMASHLALYGHILLALEVWPMPQSIFCRYKKENGWSFALTQQDLRFAQD
jgi:hypothetical protein